MGLNWPLLKRPARPKLKAAVSALMMLKRRSVSSLLSSCPKSLANFNASMVDPALIVPT